MLVLDQDIVQKIPNNIDIFLPVYEFANSATIAFCPNTLLVVRVSTLCTMEYFNTLTLTKWVCTTRIYNTVVVIYINMW